MTYFISKNDSLKTCSSSFNWVVWACLGYLYVLNVPHTIAAQYIFTGLMTLGLCWQLFKGQLSAREWPFLATVFFLVCLLCVISTIASPYRMVSFPGLRKEVLPYFLTFVLLISQRFNPETRNRLISWVMGTLLLAYATRVGLAMWDGVSHEFAFSIYELTARPAADGHMAVLPKFIDYFAIDSTLYLPIVFAFLFFSNCSHFLKLPIYIFTGIGLYIVFASGVRTAFAIVFFSLMIAIVWRCWRRPAFWLALVMFAIIGSYQFRAGSDVNINRYVSIFNIKSFSQGPGNDAYSAMGGRFHIWKAMVEIDSKSPVLGFGLGWKKIPMVASDTGLVSEWEERASDPIYAEILDYFSFGEGRVNPHNLLLLVIFEVGLIGAFVFATFLCAMLYEGRRLVRLENNESWIGVATLLYVLCYAVLGITNATWFSGTWLGLAIVLALCPQSRLMRSA